MHPHFEPKELEHEEDLVALKKMRMVNSFLQISTSGLLPIASQDLKRITDQRYLESVSLETLRDELEWLSTCEKEEEQQKGQFINYGLQERSLLARLMRKIYIEQTGANPTIFTKTTQKDTHPSLF